MWVHPGISQLGRSQQIIFNFVLQSSLSVQSSNLLTGVQYELIDVISKTPADSSISFQIDLKTPWYNSIKK
jgi:hypothetical protein